MIAPNSLSAFSGASPTAPLHRPNPVRPVRGQGEDAPPPVLLDRAPLPAAPPGPRPRGSLLNLSV